MKKIFLSVIFTIFVLLTYSQDSVAKAKIYKNEFGIDATTFIKQFLNVNQTTYSSFYLPTYYVTYRRHFKSGNIRFAIGGDYLTQEIPTQNPSTDPNKYYKSSYSIDARIGWEFFNNLNKRWQVFYGVDFRPTYSFTKNDAQYMNGGYANGYESENQIYGIGPLLGFRYKLIERLSLTTETNFAINLQQSSSKRYYTPINSTYSPIPEEILPKSNKIYTGFSQPISITLTFDI